MPVENLKKLIHEFVTSEGVQLFGVASAQAFAERFPDKAPPSRFLEGARSIVVLGMPYLPTTISTVTRSKELLPFYEDPEDMDNPTRYRSKGAGSIYTGHTGPGSTWFASSEKVTIYIELNRIGYKLTSRLLHEGIGAFYFQINTKDPDTRRAPFEHMPAAYMAGLGTLGLNCCIINPTYGSRFLITSVLIDAEMPADGPIEEEICTKCNKCVKICPVGALDGDGWKEPFKCYCCTRCIAVCPIGTFTTPRPATDRQGQISKESKTRTSGA